MGDKRGRCLFLMIAARPPFPSATNCLLPPPPCLPLCVQGLVFTGLLCRTMPYFRDRILADPLFLFKVGAEVVIDSGACSCGGQWGDAATALQCASESAARTA